MRIKNKKLKTAKEIFARIWAIWGFIVFLITMLFFFPFYLPVYILKEPAAAKYHRIICQWWMTSLIYGIGCSYKIFGKKNYEAGTNYVIVCNHNSFMDIVMTTPFLPRANKTIAKKELARIPIFGWIYAMGSVLVDRKNERNRRKSFDDMKKILSIGLDMVIYPEGTRNRTNKPLIPFQDGAFRLAVDTHKPILPVIIFNTKKVLPANKSFFLMPHKIEMHVLPIVQTHNISAHKLKEKVFEIMWNYFEQHQFNNSSI